MFLFFVLLLSYVFADGELNFNYFAVEVKSCFMSKNHFPVSTVVFSSYRLEPVLTATEMHISS